MTRAEARKLIAQLDAEGVTDVEIANRLFEAGYRSRRTGSKLSAPGISYLRNSGKRRKMSPAVASKAVASKAVASKAVASKAVASKAVASKLKAIRHILTISGMDAMERIALALLVIE